MNEDTVAGKLKSAGGKIKQKTGEAVGNQKLANAGVADQVKGAAQEAFGKTKDAAKTVKAAVKKDTANHTTANKVRDKVAAAVEDTKNFIGSAMDQLQDDVHRHELDRDGREVHQVH